MKKPLETARKKVPAGAPSDGTSELRPADRRPYEKPRVIGHGRLADIALGGSPGAGDTGGGLTQMPP